MSMGFIEVRKKNQVTLPKVLATKLNIQEGDLLEYTIEEGKIIITPKMLVSKDQAWFWSEEWQQGEHEVQREIKKNGYGKAKTAKELLKELADA
jgi:AbrB family looped-hinge helix DNA binding protein